MTADTNSNTSEINATEQTEAQKATDAKEPIGTVPSEIALLQEQLKEKEAKYIYLYAEFENYKKRAVKERSDLVKFGWENVARELLGALDNLERAMAHVPPGSDKNFVDGLKMVTDHFKQTMQRQGVAEVPGVGQAFDPNLHDAIAQEQSDKPEGVIIVEHSKGYTLHGRLLRASRVVVSKGPSAGSN